MIRWFVGLFAAILAVLLGVPSPAVAIPRAPALAVYTYDSPTRASVETTAATELGPPASYDVHTAFDAVDLWSGGDSVRLDDATPGLTTTYVTLAEFAEGAQAAGTTWEQAQGSHGPSVVLDRSGVAAKSGAAGAGNVVNGAPLRAQLAGKEIAGGHAFEKHILDLGEFPGIRTQAQFASHIEDVVMNGQMRNLGGGRTGFWRDGTVVIRNPRASDGGTAFLPQDGHDYFLNQLH